ncbi:MAG: DNA-directed DNA polymerase II small subunit [Methanomassiliicoccales archaeon]|nr:DNA-directed DNA polymerase II small subunit [Methanomassiliicoccales archaeon]
MRERVLDMLAREGILLEPDAAELVLTKEDPLAFVHTALSSLEQQPLIITLGDLVNRSSTMDVTGIIPEPQTVEGIVPRNELVGRDVVVGKTVAGEVKVIKDITGNSTCEGNINDFARYFADRFKTIKRMLVHRRELAGCVSISKALKLDRDVRVVAIVNDVKITKNRHRILEVEDDEDRCLALILKDSPLMSDSVVPDEVIGIVGKTNRKGEMIVVDEIIRPDVPLRGPMERSDSTSSIAFVSDIHAGSNAFLQRPWNDMVSWLRNEGYYEGVRYVLVPGDCVDGIGIFPDQEEELLVDDIFKQYELLSELLKDIPDGIKLIVQPGNHDAVRPAEPQPAFPKGITDMFDSQVLFVGNPCYVEIEGRLILSYHGRSMDDLIGSIQGLTYNNPLDAMKEMLRRRHLAPTYGGKTPIAPEKKDFLVIDAVPDFFVTGHVHGAGISDYRGVRLINASTWQAQTSYQRMHNFNPDPAKLPVVHLGTGRCVMKNFN